jgi:hypothetical protein
MRAGRKDILALKQRKRRPYTKMLENSRKALSDKETMSIPSDTDSARMPRKQSESELVFASRKNGRDCEKDYWNQRHCRGGGDRDNVYQQSQGRVIQSRRQSERPNQEQKAKRRSLGDEESDYLVATLQ